MQYPDHFSTGGSELPPMDDYFGEYAKNSLVLQGTPDKRIQFPSEVAKDSMKRMEVSFADLSGSFCGCGFAESRFEDVLFAPCQFENSNMQFCSFNGCTFIGDGCNGESPERGSFRGNWLDQSIFVECEFLNIDFDFSSMSNSRFINCSFRNCRTWGATIELSTFDHCSFTEVEFNWGNFEYANFISCTYDEFSISISQAPYVFGFDDQLKNQSVSYSNDRTLIDTEAYRAQLTHCIEVYLSKGEYFPAANMYQALHEYVSAFHVIKEGIRTLSLERKYDRVLRLAQLASTFSNLTREQMLELLNQVDAPCSAGTDTMRSAQETIDNQRFILYYPDIQKYLLALPGNNQKMRIAIYSEASSQRARMELLDKIESSLAAEGKVFHSVEIQHNSDIVITLDISFAINNASIIVEYVQNILIPQLTSIGLSVAGNAIWDAIREGLLPSGIIGLVTFKANRNADHKLSHARHIKNERCKNTPSS